MGLAPKTPPWDSVRETRIVATRVSLLAISDAPFRPRGAVGAGPPGPFLASCQSSRLHATSLSHALATSSRSAGKNESPISALLRIDRYIS